MGCQGPPWKGEQRLVTSVCCSYWLVFHNPVTEACFGVGNMSLNCSSSLVATGLWDLGRVSLWVQTDQG